MKGYSEYQLILFTQLTFKSKRDCEAYQLLATFSSEEPVMLEVKNKLNPVEFLVS